MASKPLIPQATSRFGERGRTLSWAGDGLRSFLSGAGNVLGWGWIGGVVAGASLAFAQLEGHVQAVRASLGILATAGVVILVLAAQSLLGAHRLGVAAGAGKPLAGAVAGSVGIALFGVVGAAALLPWLGPSAGRFWGAPYQAAAVGLASAALGTALGAPLALAVAEVTARRRSQRTSRLPVAPTGGPTIRPPEFTASPQDPFGADTLGRRRQVEEFCDSLDGMGTPVVRTVEGAWGSGKTAFGRMCVAWIAQRRLVGATVWFDAQRHGVTGVPLVDLVVAVGRDLEAAEAVAGVRTPPQVRRARRHRIADLAATLEEPRRLLREFARGDEPLVDTVEDLRALLEDYVASAGGKVLVWIDNLDRCAPAYALAMLRSIESVCVMPGVATVLAVHPDALEGAVAAIHGASPAPGERSGESYLRRYVDDRYALSTPGEDRYEKTESRDGFAQALYKGSEPGRLWRGAPLAFQTMRALARNEAVSLRDFQRVLGRLRLVFARLPDPPPPPEPPSSMSAGDYWLANHDSEQWAAMAATATALAILFVLDRSTYETVGHVPWSRRKEIPETILSAIIELGLDTQPEFEPHDVGQAAAKVLANTHEDAEGRRTDGREIFAQLARLVGSLCPPPPAETVPSEDGNTD